MRGHADPFHHLIRHVYDDDPILAICEIGNGLQRQTVADHLVLRPDRSFDPNRKHIPRSTIFGTPGINRAFLAGCGMCIHRSNVFLRSNQLSLDRQIGRLAVGSANNPNNRLRFDREKRNILDI